jgi:acetyl-CoA carboxylase biotin carboxyl carrier protein
MNLKEIKELIEMLQGTDISEIEVEREGARTRIRRGPPLLHPRIEQVPPPTAEKEGAKIESPVAPDAHAAEPEVPELAAGQIVVTSPMVGTFYRAPSQGAPAFVEVGAAVEPGQPLCIIEAMKLMNEIEAEQGGKILKILKEDKDPVEFGEPLFILESL